MAGGTYGGGSRSSYRACREAVCLCYDWFSYCFTRPPPSGLSRLSSGLIFLVLLVSTVAGAFFYYFLNFLSASFLCQLPFLPRCTLHISCTHLRPFFSYAIFLSLSLLPLIYFSLCVSFPPFHSLLFSSYIIARFILFFSFFPSSSSLSFTVCHFDHLCHFYIFLFSSTIFLCRPLLCFFLVFSVFSSSHCAFPPCFYAPPSFFSLTFLILSLSFTYYYSSSSLSSILCFFFFHLV